MKEEIVLTFLFTFDICTERAGALLYAATRGKGWDCGIVLAIYIRSLETLLIVQ